MASLRCGSESTVITCGNHAFVAVRIKSRPGWLQSSFAWRPSHGRAPVQYPSGRFSSSFASCIPRRLPQLHRTKMFERSPPVPCSSSRNSPRQADFPLWTKSYQSMSSTWPCGQPLTNRVATTGLPLYFRRSSSAVRWTRRRALLFRSRRSSEGASYWTTNHSGKRGDVIPGETEPGPSEAAAGANSSGGVPPVRPRRRAANLGSAIASRWNVLGQ